MAQPSVAVRGAPLTAYPWYAIGMTLLAAAVASALLFYYARGRAAEYTDHAAALQGLRLRQVAVRAETNAASAAQDVTVAAALLGPLRDKTEIGRDLKRILLAANPTVITGAGVFFAPYAFNPQVRLQGFYTNRHMIALNQIHGISDRTRGDYTVFPWYRDAVAANGKLVFTHPYFGHGHTYISGAKAFYSGGKLEGVAIVDAIRATLNHNMRVSLEPGDVAYVRDDAGRTIAATGPLPSPAITTQTQSIRFRGLPWTLYLTSDFSAFAASQRAVWIGAGLGVLLLWALTGVVVASLVRTERFKAQAARLEQESYALRITAYHDALTGLPNRAQILETIQRAIDSAGGAGYAVFFIDLDKFAVINDSLGHSTGDALLRQIAERVTPHLPDGAQLARLGGDEFLVYVPLTGTRDVHALANRILESLRRPFSIEGRTVYTGASLGVVVGNARYKHPEELLRDADIAMYRAKESGRARFVVFDENMHERALQRLLIESALRSAVQHSEFSVHYQPIIEIATGDVCALEALCRWERPDYGQVQPSDFIPVAEQTGAISAIDAFVLRQACSEAARVSKRFGKLPVSVNVSAMRLTHGDLIPGISHALAESGIEAGALQLEITETAIMAQPELAIEALEQLRELGVGVVIDDFGAGYSSLSYVQRLPISGLKIDRSFITPVAVDVQSEAIVRAIVGLAKTLGLHVTAEGVETPHQLEVLAGMGVDYAQGFLFSPAVPFDELDSVIGLAKNT